MKILYVITKANWGGAQRYVYDLATASQTAHHETVVAYGEPGVLVDKLSLAGIRTIALPHVRNQASFSALRNAERALYSLFLTERPDLVHLNSSLVSAAGARAARKAGVSRIVFTAHGWAFNENRSFLQKLGIRYIAWRTIRDATMTICVSNAIQRDVCWLPCISRKLTIIHNGVESPHYMERVAARHKLAPNFEPEYWIGMISELHPTKCIEDAINALTHVSGRRTDVGLVVMGEGSERARLERLVDELGLHKRVRLAGFVADAPEYLRAFDLFVQSSQSEALGLAVLEAGAASLPVVATRVGGIPEIITDGIEGLLVPARDPKALADAMDRFISNATFSRECATRLNKRVSSAFSKIEMVRATLALYQTL